MTSCTITVYKPTRRHVMEDFNFFMYVYIDPFIANELTCAAMNIAVLVGGPLAFVSYALNT